MAPNSCSVILVRACRELRLRIASEQSGDGRATATHYWSWHAGHLYLAALVEHTLQTVGIIVALRVAILSFGTTQSRRVGGGETVRLCYGRRERH